MTRIATPGAPGANALPVLGFPGGVPTALAADAGRGRVYAGTTNPNGRDTVDVLNVATGDVETYASGLSGVGAMAVGSRGELYVTDDPASAAGAIGVIGQGRLWKVEPVVTGRPHVAIDTAPGTYTNATTATFAFSSPTVAAFRCRFDDGAAQDCGLGKTGTYAEGDVAEGLHTFSVQAVDPDDPSRAGEPLRRTFIVDRTAPVVTIDNSSSDATIETTALAVRFSADETDVEFTCSLDGATPAACDAPLRLSGLALGEHEVVVAGADRAGNASAPARFAFRRQAPLPKPAADSAPAPAPAPAPAAEDRRGSSQATPATTPATNGRIEVLGQQCRRLAAPRVSWARWSRSRRSLVVRVRPLKDSVFLRLTLRGPRRAATSRPGSPLVTAILPGHATQLTWRLRADQVARLRSGRYALAVASASCGTRFGAATVVRPRAAR